MDGQTIRYGVEDAVTNGNGWLETYRVKWKAEWRTGRDRKRTKLPGVL